MGGLKTLVVTALTMVSLPNAMRADADLVQTFANCAGRYSAEMEHAWLINDPTAEEFEARRGGFVSLLEATTTSETAQQAINRRVSSKFAHAALLQVATFNLDEATSSAARRTATQYLERCELLLLGGT